MMSLLPTRADVAPDPSEPAVLDLAGADDAFDVLGSRTARDILAALYEEPRPPTEVREIVGTSLQNVHYHLGRLEEAGLIEPAGTGYSEKGTEMTVYAPAREAVVLFAGREHDRSRLRDLLARALGAVAMLALGALAFAWLVGELRPDSAEGSEWQAQSSRADTLASESTGGQALDLASLLSEPAVAFFLGGVVVLGSVGILWYLRR